MPLEQKKPTLGALIDTLYERRSARLNLQSEVDELKTQETKITEQIFTLMDESDQSKSAGKIASASSGEREFAVVKDWPAFYAYIKKNDYFHLLQRRPADAAVKELFHEAQVEVDGVVLDSKRVLNLGKITK